MGVEEGDGADEALGRSVPPASACVAASPEQPAANSMIVPIAAASDFLVTRPSSSPRFPSGHHTGLPPTKIEVKRKASLICLSAEAQVANHVWGYTPGDTDFHDMCDSSMLGPELRSWLRTHVETRFTRI